jgi:hypothetical protein
MNRGCRQCSDTPLMTLWLVIVAKLTKNRKIFVEILFFVNFAALDKDF